MRLLLLSAMIMLGCENTNPNSAEGVPVVDTVTIHDTVFVDHSKYNLELVIHDSGGVSVTGYGNYTYYNNVESGPVTYLSLETWSIVHLAHAGQTGYTTFDLDTVVGDTIYRIDGEWRVN